MTAIEWLLEEWPILVAQLPPQIIDQAKEMEREQMIDFHNWMRRNDTAENAEQYFHYTDEDMLTEYYNQTYGTN